jgi:hypothetical protein
MIENNKPRRAQVYMMNVNGLDCPAARLELGFTRFLNATEAAEWGAQLTPIVQAVQKLGPLAELEVCVQLFIAFATRMDADIDQAIDEVSDLIALFGSIEYLPEDDSHSGGVS